MGGASGLLIRRSHQLHYGCQGLRREVFFKDFRKFNNKRWKQGTRPFSTMSCEKSKTFQWVVQTGIMGVISRCCDTKTSFKPNIATFLEHLLTSKKWQWIFLPLATHPPLKSWSKRSEREDLVKRYYWNIYKWKITVIIVWNILSSASSLMLYSMKSQCPPSFREVHPICAPHIQIFNMGDNVNRDGNIVSSLCTRVLKEKKMFYICSWVLYI